ncbi:hypothetical protein NY78_1024 [Desulfovibrio sp. TomC]|nr:hypothetical protein NY78_1024 [Desulfovibrio sp. TomC]
MFEGFHVCSCPEFGTAGEKRQCSRAASGCQPELAGNRKVALIIAIR